MKDLKIFMLLFSLVSLTFFGCSKDDPEQASRVETTEIANTFLPSNESIAPQNGVITNQAEWQELLDTLESVDPAILERFSDTNLDFDKVQVLAVFDQVRPHTGHYVKISRVLSKEDILLASVIKESTEEGFTILIQPFHILSIEKSNKAVVFD